MTDHPLTEARAAEMWDRCHDETGILDALAAMRAAYDAGYLAAAVALKPLDPLAENIGKVIRDVETTSGNKADVGILDGHEGVVADWGHGIRSMLQFWITAFTTDDRTIRYTRHGNTWITETLKDTND